MASTAIIKVTPVSGAREDSAPACVLLEIDEARILLDCGASPGLDFSAQLEALRRLAPARTGGTGVELDLVLVSHGDVAHIGGLPALVAALATPCPVLGTLPQHHMGLVAVYDAYEGCHVSTGAPPANGPSLDAVDAAFERMTLLRYAQPFVVPAGAGRAAGVTAVALASGRTLGGALWRIRRRGDEVVYAAGLCHRREAVLDGAALEALPRRAALLLADATSALDAAVPRDERDAEVVGAVLRAVRAGGTALVPVETAGRTLEAVLVLEQYWRAHAELAGVPVLLVGPQARRTLELARGMLEWMGAALTRQFEADRTNAFDVRFVRPVADLAEARAVPEPRVVLATHADVSAADGHGAGGPVLGLFGDVAGDSRSALVFLSRRPAPGTLGAALLSPNAPKSLIVAHYERVALSGDELAAHEAAARERAEQRAAEDAFAELQRLREDVADAAEDDEAPGAEEAAVDAIGSAAALRAVCWTDYRRDWHVPSAELRAAGRGGLAAAANAAHLPLLPADAPSAVAGMPGRYQAFPHRAFYMEPARATAALEEYGEPLDVRRDLGASHQETLHASLASMGVRTDGVSVGVRTDGVSVGGRTENFSLGGRMDGVSVGGRMDSVSHGVHLSADTGALLDPSAPVGGHRGDAPKSSDEAPAKWVRVERSVALRCAVRAVAFDGHADGRSLRAIYGRVQPRRLVLVAGSSFATDYLANHTRLASAGATDVYAPDAMQTVVVSSAADVVQAVLGEDAVAATATRALGDYELAWLRSRPVIRLPSAIRGLPVQLERDGFPVQLGRDGLPVSLERENLPVQLGRDGLPVQLGRDGLSVPSERETPPVPSERENFGAPYADTGDSSDEEHSPAAGTLVLHAAGPAETTACPRLLGDPKLSEVRRALAHEYRMPAAFVAGDLVVGAGDARVAVRRDADTGALLVEGPVCPEYYAVRALIYQQTAFVGL